MPIASSTTRVFIRSRVVELIKTKIDGFIKLGLPLEDVKQLTHNIDSIAKYAEKQLFSSFSTDKSEYIQLNSEFLHTLFAYIQVTLSKKKNHHPFDDKKNGI